ncbi:MAG: hypothetical protein LRY55_06590 [Leadbetterella sp.]|nr:hypothetical protein [Leadbetterella sp.]
MKKTITIVCLLLISISSYAQRSRDARLEDSLFTWKGIPQLKSAAYARAFTPAQLKHPGLFAEWLRKSYLPVGALDFSYAVAEPDRKDEVTPYGTGINAAMWRAVWDNAGTKVIREPHSENPVWMLTNHIIDAQPVRMLTVPGRSVFMRRSPDIEKAFSGSSERRNRFVRQLQLEKHPQTGKYLIQYYGCDGDGCQPRVAVYLAPGNRLPIRQLTRGEVLELIEEAIPSEITVARNKLKSTFGHRPQSLEEEYRRFDETVLPRWKAHLGKLKEKYGNSLHLPAEMRDGNGIEMIQIFNGDDIFAEESLVKKQNTYGIYTYEDGVLEKSKQDQPLWICISWLPADIQYSPYAREIHRSMITHFNFDYVYDYFFRPQSVQQKPYSILNEEEQKAHLASYPKKKEPAEKRSGGLYFSEDFSGDLPGEKPRAWYMPGAGVPAVVATPPGETGNWVKLGQYDLMPAEMKQALPENFTMEFDVATDENFTENTGGAFLLKIHNKILTPNGDYKNAPKPVSIDLDAKAGNVKFSQNPTGYIRLKATYTGMNSALRYADVLQNSNLFSNQKNKVHFTVTRQGNKVQGFIDGREIIALDKYGKAIPGFNELPDGVRFTSFSFENITGSSSKHLGIYITNIKIAAR